MTVKTSLGKDKIKFLLLEGVHQSAVETLNQSGYTNIDYLKTEADCCGVLLYWHQPS